MARPCSGKRHAGIPRRREQTVVASTPNRPPGQDALAELARLKGLTAVPAPVIDLGRYAAFGEVAC
jgi:hypothetical protein